MKTIIKELRVEIDGLSRIVKGLNPMGTTDGNGILSYDKIPSVQTAKAYDSLILAKSWLGKVLGVLNIDSPYQNDGKRKTVEDIEPTADKVVNGENPFPHDFTHIQKADWLRQRIKDLAHKIDLTDTNHKLWEKVNEHERSAHFIFNSFTHLNEARFWLGFELERIREEK